MTSCKACNSTATLLIQSVEGVKSVVAMTIGNITCRVILIIENTQALSANQVSKSTNTIRAYRLVKAFQLVTIKS